MFSQTRTDIPALEQLRARNPLPAPSRFAVELAWRYVLWTQRRKSRRELARLDARMLQDIGLTPKQAQLESRKWFWRP